MALCFHYADLRESFGDLNQVSVEEAWQGAHRVKRRAHVAGGREGVCAGCNCGISIELPKFGSSLYPECLYSEI